MGDYRCVAYFVCDGPLTGGSLGESHRKYYMSLCWATLEDVSLCTYLIIHHFIMKFALILCVPSRCVIGQGNCDVITGTIISIFSKYLY